MERDWTDRVRAVLAATRPVDPANSLGFGCRRAVRFHAGGPTWAAQIEEIRRIARWYGWQAEVDAVLASAGVASLKGLDDDALAALHTRMRSLETCIQEGLDPLDGPPAR